MAKIAYILLCHKDPDAVIRQAERLTDAGDFISIHFDASADPADFAQIMTALKNNPNVTFAKKRVNAPQVSMCLAIIKMAPRIVPLPRCSGGNLSAVVF